MHGAQRSSVLVVEDHPIVRDGIRQLIERQPDLHVCGEASDLETARELAASLKPNVVLVDIALGRHNGLELIRELSENNPECRIIVLSMYDEAMFAERALRAGARGYVMKHEATETLLVALRKVLSGGVHLSERASGRLLQALVPGRRVRAESTIAQLTDREMDVFRLIGTGNTTREIAQSLHVSVKTVESHRQRIKEKLGMGSTTELIVHAARWVQQGP
jgi:DNA-binding NarL/FixJ family response regulator